MRKWTYAKAGVDLDKVKSVHEKIERILLSTWKFQHENIIGKFGHYVSLLRIGRGVLAFHTDGVGTKVLIAQMMRKYDTIGIDCVAMNVNDIICVGAKPLALVDYLALEKADENLISEIMLGLKKGAELAQVAVVGGETAIMPDVIKGINGKGFDLAATCIGVVDEDKIVDGSHLKIGDKIIGVKSSGIHSNGMTLARKILFDELKLSVNDYVAELDAKIGEELLKPTLIYVEPVLQIIESGIEVHGFAHITGGAFSKLNRFMKYAEVHFSLKLSEPPPIFKFLQEKGGIPTEEMYRTFNMGIGFCIVLPQRSLKDAISILEECKYEAEVIGEVREGKGVSIITPSREIVSYT